MDFNNCSNIIRNLLPNKNNAVIRRLTLMWMRMACLAMAAGIDVESRFAKQARGLIMYDYKVVIATAIGNPMSGTKMGGRLFPQHELQYLAAICKGFTSSFCCRRTTCMFFGFNDEWLKDPDSYHFTCPRCGYAYHPFASKTTCEEFQFVISMPDLTTGGTLVIPALWPDGLDEKCLRGQMEVHALQIDTQEKLNAYTLKDAEMDLHKLVQSAVPATFKEIPWNKTLCMANKAPKYDVSLYMEGKNLFGDRLDKGTHGEAIANPFKNWHMMAAIMGKIIANSPRSADGELKTVFETYRE
jgi:hypothetical protein